MDAFLSNGKAAGGDAGNKTPTGKIEKQYQKKSQLEHILLRPDTYIGSVEHHTEQMWVYDSEKNAMEKREITYVPGLFKIFDEILVNAADNKQRDPTINTIKIEIKPEENVISIYNNGEGIPVVLHKEQKMYVPTMIFGHLLTSSNYNDEDDKVTGGRNGYGAKLCNIFSSSFIVETSSKEYKKSFRQKWADNMSKTSEPKIKEDDGDFTKVTFSPDLSKFKMDKLDKDIVDLMSRRACDVAASTGGVKVFLNGKNLQVLFTCLKRTDKREIKVAQLAGSVAEQSAYHHGEVSLMSTIINLAQNYVGSNNINLLQPLGQFGTRLQGGKDAASPRYIFTMLNPLTRLIFHPDDDLLLKYLKDDNLRVEPQWYMPVIPMLLVNGAEGIGTGWMTKIPNHNPREIVANIKRMMQGEEPLPMKPWYKNFLGEIDPLGLEKFVVNGEVGIISDTRLEITELPVGTWTQNYKESVLEPMLHGADKTPACITEYKEYNTDATVKFVITMSADKLAQAENEGLHKFFKLQTLINSSINNCLKRYTSAIEVLKEFFPARMLYYEKRKDNMAGTLEAETRKLSNQAR
ncbi:DNA topoisomerase 2-like [Nilaparvata lugens]|uniref:DNA topoisomerase 2-like n=1 Tax=Nilaparvata lugens TaxID=108931 RepID=UPI00193CD77D|nr:DNA topoisomerase 2-like [Nilaparvata lugens]